MDVRRGQGIKKAGRSPSGSSRKMQLTVTSIRVRRCRQARPLWVRFIGTPVHDAQKRRELGGVKTCPQACRVLRAEYGPASRDFVSQSSNVAVMEGRAGPRSRRGETNLAKGGSGLGHLRLVSTCEGLEINSRGRIISRASV